jgi:hypothetical protein
MNSGRVQLVVQGYYNPVEANLGHPLILNGLVASAIACPVFGQGVKGAAIILARSVRAVLRAESLISQLNGVVISAERMASSRTGSGDRVTFVPLVDRFRGQVKCDGSGFVQPLNIVTIGEKNGDDCTHPNAKGAGVIASIVSLAFQ